MPRTKETLEPSEENTSKTNMHATSIRNNSALTPLLMAIVVLLVLAVLGGVFALGRHSNRFEDRPFIYGTNGRYTTMGPTFGNHRMGGYLDSENRVVGVVTQVNGDHFTVAANGATKDVQTTSSTQYEDGSSVKVNDSVIVFGSTTNNQFSADQVVVNP